MMMLVFLAALILTSTATAKQCVPGERQALLKLKSGIPDFPDYWYWNGTDCCAWNGVSCDETTGRVIGVYLPQFSRPKSTSILTALAGLPYLQTLDGRSQSFQGPIPTALSRLSRLQSFYLSDNPGLNGSLPAFLFRLPNLVQLDLSCSYCRSAISGSFPNSFPKSSKLRDLQLSGAKIGGIIPPALGNLLNLEYLDLSNNNFHGSIPASLGGLSKLFLLQLGNNPNLRGPIPSSFSGLHAMVAMRIANTGLTGSIPDIFNGMPDLGDLQIQQNFLTGTFPKTLSPKGKLVYLDASNNSLSGPFPIGYSNLTNLQWLDLSYNKFTSLPSDLRALETLSTLKLSGNPLKNFDSVKALSGIPLLYRIELSKCGLKGPIPTWLSKLNPAGDPEAEGGSVNIDLSFNSITGTISADFGNMENLGYLYLGHNKITGIIPASLGNLPGLKRLDLSKNQLAGSIPDSLAKLWMLRSLNLSYNKIAGGIPAGLGNLTDLGSLDLSRNRLTGSIPESFLNLYLNFLDLSYNRLSGKIPQGEALTKFNSSSYQGNAGLCGYPLKAC